MNTPYANRFAIAYAIIGAQALASVALFIAILFTPVTPVAHKSDVTNSLGATTTKALVAEAEKEIASEASSAGLTVLGQKVTAVKNPDKDTVLIFIRLKTAEQGTINVKVTFHKGIYTIAGVEAS